MNSSPSIPTTPWLSEDECNRIESLIAPLAGQYETKPEHWLHGHDEGLSYCPACALAEIARLQSDHPDREYDLDGGWGIEGDGLEYCEICEHPLNNHLTRYGAECELEAFEEEGFDLTSQYQCYALSRILDSHGFGPYADLPGSPFQLQQRHEFYRRLHALCRSILAAN